jgi:cytochrome c peroxidase
MKKIIVFSLLGIGALTMMQCTKFTSTGSAPAPTLPSTAFHYAINIPNGTIDNTPSHNPISDDGATLGRVLFFDKQLSINNANACASCHQQENGFADPVAKSRGFEGELTSRNSMSIINAANENSYFWDGRTDGLEEMVLQPVRHQIEMGMEKMDVLPAKLAKTAYYPELFKKAFGTTEITSDRISLAMAQFIRSMSSYKSLADESGVARNWGFDSANVLNTAQKAGAQLFFGQAGCANCHSGTNFRGMTDNDMANIGLDMEYTDNGIGTLKNDASKNGVFRIPSLRNIALTAPYMHDGRFATLKDVVNHYNKGVNKHANLDNRLRNSGGWGGSDDNPRRLNLTDNDVNNLVEFLKTITDKEVTTHARFSDPFAAK